MLHLEIITPERVAYTDDVDMVTVPGADGQLGILPKHTALFAQLKEGELKIKKGDEEYFLAIGGGFVEVTKTKVMIFVTRAVNADELNQEEIMRAKREAEEALKRPITSEESAMARAQLRQTLLDLKIINKKRRTSH